MAEEEHKAQMEELFSPRSLDRLLDLAKRTQAEIDQLEAEGKVG